MTAISKARSGPPEAAISLKRMMQQHQGIFIASPEYNASVTPLLKNSLDWVSRVREGKEAPLAVYKDRAFAIGGASNGGYGAMRSLMALRQVLEQRLRRAGDPRPDRGGARGRCLRRDGQFQG